MTLRHDIARLERELGLRDNGGGEPMATWPANKSAICQKLGLDATSIANTAQDAWDAGYESIAAQVASMLGMTLAELRKALTRRRIT